MATTVAQHSVARASWIALVLVVTLMLTQRYFSQFVAGLEAVGLLAVLLSAFSLVVAKLCFAGFTSDIVAAVTRTPTCWRFGFYAYNASQVAKYLPGNVWQHASRAAIYHRAGIAKKPIGMAIAIEALVLVLGAVVVATFSVLVLLPERDRLEALWDAVDLPFDFKAMLVSLGVVCLLCVAAGCLALSQRSMRGRLVKHRRILARVAVASLWLLPAWIFLGLSLTLLLPLPSGVAQGLLPVTGLFAFAFAAGFVTPFAPAGLGVREAVLTLGLAPFLATGPILIAVASHRLLYVLGDLTFAGLALALGAGSGPVLRTSLDDGERRVRTDGSPGERR